MIDFPRYPIGLTGRTDEAADPTSGVQFAVLFPDGERFAYGDQSWVAYGTCLKDLPDGCRIEQRSISISYGEWAAVEE